MRCSQWCFLLLVLILEIVASCDWDDCDEGMSLRQLRGQKTSQAAWSFEKPDPELLIWDRIMHSALNSTTGRVNRTIYNGWLKVPLVHDPALMEFEMPPYVCLRVRGLAALKPPAKNGPMLAHCGGPGSGRDCAMTMSAANFDIDGRHAIISDFDLLSIDQRGVNTSSDRYERAGKWGEVPPCPFNLSGRPLSRFPTIYCDEIAKYVEEPRKLMKLLTPIQGNASVEHHWKTYVEPIWRSGKIPYADMAPTNETFVRWYYRLVKLENSLCYETPRYKMRAPNGRVYNAMQFASTVDCAHDIDLLRRAIGADRMSWYGASYGTSVAGVYASIFPEVTHRVVMDGAVNPRPDTEARSGSCANGIQAVWGGIEKDCETSLVRNLSADEVCPAAPRVSSKALHVLKGSNRTEASYLLELMLFTVFHAEALAPLAMACIEQFYSGKEVEGCNKVLPMLSSYRIASNSSNSTKAKKDRFGLAIQSAVMGTDSAGRFDEEEFINWWRRVKDTDPIGSLWAKNWMVAMSTWPAYARPVPPVADAGIEAVIIGNLHDPNTAYENAQLLKRNFPEGYLVTWQGYGHCLTVPQHAMTLLKSYNKSKANNTLPEYTNGVAKYACMSKIL